MTQGWSAKQQSRATTSTRVTNRLENRRVNFNEVTDIDRQPSFHDKAAGVLGCKHYQRSAKLQAHCCGKWDTCRFCHDEVSDHNIVRNLITTMMCMYCGTVQPAGQDCINDKCNRRVAKYYCKECKLWDSDPRKNIYHCYDCGICRIGKGLGIDYFHCKKCNVCMAISLKGRHKCIERNLESDCPICGEYMFTSTTTVIFMPCGHCIHYKCHQEYIQTSYQCPTCLKSLADMSDYFRRIDLALAQQQMPQEYTSLYNQIYCNDCEKKCHAKFHFMYHKCVNCRGYNTKVLNTLDKAHVPADQLRLIAAINPQAAATLVSSPTSPNTAVNPDIPSVQDEAQLQHASSGSIRSSSSRRASMIQRGVSYWCHQCQGSTNPVMVDGSQRCVTCDSDFLEQL
ncbi:zinc-ribbon-domain-containing protein [Phlyctochytrium arcticum]|nr:zinc-ribbon-domain-containing protein [Phlyctochytrium arcticum]